MNFDINTVVIGGRLTRDPRFASTDGGSMLTEFPVAINRRFHTSTGESRRETTFIDVIVWGKDKVAFVAESLAKGSGVIVEGRLERVEWVSNDGTKRNRIRVVAEKLYNDD